MRSILRYKTFVYLALLSWLLVSGSGVYGHFCFDGKEPPVSVHMNLLDNHADPHVDEAHDDIDVDLAKWLIAKLVKIDLPTLALLVLVITLLASSQRTFFFRYTALHKLCHSDLRPPLRAPPFFPA